MSFSSSAANPFSGVALTLPGEIENATYGEIPRIPPNFWIREFTTKKEALAFLRKFAFDLILERSDYTVWETLTKPKVRANMYQDKRDVWVVARQQRKID